MAKVQEPKEPVDTGFADPDTGFRDGEPTSDTPLAEPTSDDLADTQPVVPDEERSGISGIEGIRYLGRADVRRLSGADLERMGATDVTFNTIEWTKASGNVVSVQGLSQSVIDTLAKHPEFEVV